jgi:lipopolysaccharide export system permease protein
MMRLLDRYVLNTFLAALGVFTIAFMALFLVVDFASKLGKFLELANIPTLSFVLRYYLARLPMILTYLLPTVVLFAAIFTLIKLSRNNEILPIVASGTSVRRIARPFLATGALAGLGMAAMDEFVLARLGEEIAETDRILSEQETTYGVIVYDGQTMVYARAYDHVRREMTALQITRLDGSARTLEIVRAGACRWNPATGRWVAYDGLIEYPQVVEVLQGRPETRKRPIEASGYAVEGEFTLEDVRRESSLTSRFAFAPLEQLVEKARRYPHVPSFRLKIYSRFAFPLSPLVLLLLGLPFVAVTVSKSFLKGLIFCFLLALAYYMTHFASIDIGNRGGLPPLAAGWGPAALFGGLGLLAFARMRT